MEGGAPLIKRSLSWNPLRRLAPACSLQAWRSCSHQGAIRRVQPADQFSLPCCRNSGFEHLCKVDSKFSHFGNSLFSQQGLGISRDQITKEDNEKLNQSISSFMHLLCNHFLTPAAFKALEYLVRKFK